MILLFGSSSDSIISFLRTHACIITHLDAYAGSCIFIFFFFFSHLGNYFSIFFYFRKRLSLDLPLNEEDNSCNNMEMNTKDVEVIKDMTDVSVTSLQKMDSLEKKRRNSLLL